MFKKYQIPKSSFNWIAEVVDIVLLPIVGTLLELAKEGEVSVFRLPRLDDITMEFSKNFRRYLAIFEYLLDLSLNLKPKALK